MNPVDKEQYKAKVKKLMVDHITQVLGANYTNEQVMKELRPMWIKIEEAGLIISGMTFAHFVTIADDQYTFSQVKKAMGGQ